MTIELDRLEDAYFEWLYSQIGPLKNRNPANTHWNLCRQLHSIEFTWFVPNDDNRVEDGKALRGIFLDETRFPVLDPFGLFQDLECSVFEMLLALADRAEFQSGRAQLVWFWELIANLGLDNYTDAIYSRTIGRAIEDAVLEVIQSLIQRTYSRDGRGGLFPLTNPQQDQRDIELWYQLAAYMREKDYVEKRVKI